MNPPAGPIRAEVSDALVGGIRLRGAEAVGLVIMGLARLAIAVVVFIVLYGAAVIVGIEVTTPPPFAGMGLISALVTWLVGRDKSKKSVPGAA